MKRWHLLVPGLIVLAVITWAGPPPSFGQGRGQGFRPCPYSPYQCPIKHTCRPIDLTGKVVRVVTENLEADMYPGMAVLLDTKSEGQVHVHLGPVWYLERQEFALKPGDEVRVRGLCEKAAGKLTVIALELIKGDHALLLRDAKGRPNWEAWRKR